MPFEDVLISFPDAVPCGVKVASSGGKIILNPDDSYVLQEGDELLVIAEDDDTYSPSILPVVISSSLDGLIMLIWLYISELMIYLEFLLLISP